MVLIIVNHVEKHLLPGDACVPFVLLTCSPFIGGRKVCTEKVDFWSLSQLSQKLSAFGPKFLLFFDFLVTEREDKIWTV